MYDEKVNAELPGAGEKVSPASAFFSFVNRVSPASAFWHQGQFDNAGQNDVQLCLYGYTIIRYFCMLNILPPTFVTD
jgi:hypothetical protein